MSADRRTDLDEGETSSILAQMRDSINGNDSRCPDFFEIDAVLRVSFNNVVYHFPNSS